MPIRSVATEPDSPEVREAITTLGTDHEWEGLEPHLSIGVYRRLAKADRALYASTRLAEMLFADRLGRHDKRDNPEVEFSGLDAVDREALEIGMIELLRYAGESLDAVRENRHCCVTGS